MIKVFSNSFTLYLSVATLLVASSPPCRAQQSNQLQWLTPNGNTQNTQSCDDRFSPCPTTRDNQSQTGYSSNDPNAQIVMPDTDTRYNFGSGQPLNMSQPDYGQQPDTSQPKPVKLRPQPPTEFQKFVANDIGKMLPIFGSHLFVDAPATFAPLDKVPVTSNYVIGPGDELLLRAWGSISFYLRETVDRSGNIYIPHVGQIQVSGIAFSEMHNYLSEQISASFKKFDLSVEMGHLRSIQVFVVGRTRRPGSYTVSSLSSLVNALFISGGPSNTGSMRRIQVRRNSSVLTEFDLYDLLLNGDKSKDIPLLPGDVIYILPAGPRVALTGSVSQPAIFEIRNNETINDLLTMAGGFTSLATLNSGELERIDPHGGRHVVEIHFDVTGLKTPLQDGDILRVLSIVPKFDNAVTLRGNVANPGRFAWHEGMTIKDLIPNKDSLLTRDYWKKKNGLVFVQADHSSEADSESDDAVASDQTNAPNDSTSAPMSKSTEPNNGSQLIASQKQNGTTSAITSLAQTQTPSGTNTSQPAAGKGSIASETGSPSHRFAISNQIEKRVPEIDWDYAVIERVNVDDLTTFLKPFNLGDVVLHDDEKENFELKSGDVVTIFSQADIHVPQTRQTKFVRLEGEFKAAGVYSVKPGETLRQLVERAGGLTQQAYLFGSFFTRESTRLQQQARLDEYYSDLEQDIERASTERSNSAVNIQEAATLTASLESQRALAQKLRLLQANGRIVLDIDPEGEGLASIPDLPLEDGDSFSVPSRPSSVSVVGDVYDENAFIFKGARKANDYLQLAGGITKNGDSKHAFIIRADGSVVSRKSNIAKSKGGLEALAMNPGDAIVVPEIVNKTTLLRGLTDWSAIFSQFGLGVAAINVLH